MNDPEHIRWLRGKLTDYQQKLSQAEQTVARLRPAVAGIEATLAGLEAEEKGRTPERTLFGETVSALPPSTAFKPVLQRRPQYVELSLSKAIGEVLARHSGPLHADQAVEAIYTVASPRERKRAKDAVMSEFHRGEKRGSWLRLRGNRIMQKGATVAEAANNNSGERPSAFAAVS